MKTIVLMTLMLAAICSANSQQIKMMEDPLPDITTLEYFIDTDPGFGSGIQVPITSRRIFRQM